MTVEREKKLLRKKEIFWQSRLKTLQPTGLNKRIPKSKTDWHVITKSLSLVITWCYDARIYAN